MEEYIQFLVMLFSFLTIAKKTGCQCFVSLNIADTAIHAKIEDYLMKRIDENPRTFYF